MSLDRHLEIEHKFLVTGDGWRGLAEGTRYRQGYLAEGETAVVRVRTGGGQAWLTVKEKQQGITRSEFEYEIPVQEAERIIETLCGGRVVIKTRYRIPYAGLVWDVDEFHGVNAGLVLAEVELEREDQPFEPPPWVGDDVTEDGRYTNVRLAEKEARGERS